MIKRVKAKGWKIGDFTHELDMVNVLVGYNGTGKTSVMDAIRLVMFGEVPGLGKQNQAIMRGASKNRVSVEIEMEDGSTRTVELTRKGESVKKVASDDFVSPEVPLTVKDLMELNGEEMRKLMSLSGDKLKAEDFLDEVSAEVPASARSAVARCAIHGEGDLSDVGAWVREILDQEGREKSNVRETKGALANTQKLLENSQPVPKSVIIKWQDEMRSCELDLATTNRSLAECSENETRAVNSRRDLDAAKKRLEDAQASSQWAASALASLQKMERSDWGDEEAAEIDAKIAKLQEMEQEEAMSRALSAKASKSMEAIITRLNEILDTVKLKEDDKEKLTRAISMLDDVFFSLPNEQQEESVSTRQDEINELKRELRRIREPRESFDAALSNAGVASIEHAKERAKSASLEAAAIHQECQAKEQELFSYEGNSKAALEATKAELEATINELKKSISLAGDHDSLAITEANLSEKLLSLEDDLESMKVVAKAAVKVQADLLSRPVKQLFPALDEFSKVAKIGKIRAEFEKQGRTTTLAIRIGNVPLEAISGGEKLLVGCAFLYAIHKARKPQHPFIFVESAELDPENADRLHEGLSLAAESGIQCFMTSFTKIMDDGIIISNQMEEVA